MDAGLRTLGSRRWTLDAGLWTLVTGRWTLGAEHKTVPSFGSNRATIIHKIFETKLVF